MSAAFSKADSLRSIGLKHSRLRMILSSGNKPSSHAAALTVAQKSSTWLRDTTSRQTAYIHSSSRALNQSGRFYCDVETLTQHCMLL